LHQIDYLKEKNSYLSDKNLSDSITKSSEA